jgi:hypothetical protein
MQGTEIEEEGIALKYMTKSQFEKQCSSLLMMTPCRKNNLPHL